MLQLVYLRVDGLGDFFIAMADADGQNAAEKIQVLFTLNIVDVIALSVIEDQRLVVVGRDTGKEILSVFIYNFLFVHGSLLKKSPCVGCWVNGGLKSPISVDGLSPASRADSHAFPLLPKRTRR